MKRVARAFTLFIASATYVWLLFLTATTVSSYLALKNPDTMKMWLDESGVYTNIVDEVSKLATIQQKQENSLVQITSEDIQATARQTFTAESIQSDTEGLIDGFYGWFRGDTTGPVFTVDFSGRQALFAKAMTAKLEQKINELPECETAGRFTVQAFDPFKAECRPKGVDLTEELSSFEQEIATSKDILPKITYTGDDVQIHDKNGEPQRVATALSWVPNAYKGLAYGPWVIMGLTILSALVMIFLSSSRRKGLRRFAGGLLFTGVILIVSGLFLRPAFEQLNAWSTRSLGAQASFTQNIIDPLFRQVNTTYSRYSVIFGIAYTVPALLTYGMLIITRPRKDEEGALEQHENPHEHVARTEQQAAPVLQAEEKYVAPIEQTVQRSAPTQPQQAFPPIAVEQPQLAPQAAPVAQPLTPHARPHHQQAQSGRTYERRPPMIQG